MRIKALQIQSLYEWLVSALFFWLFLACLETVVAVILNSFSPPLGKGSLPSTIDIRYFIAALSIYSLLSIPTAFVLCGTEKIFCWLKDEIKVSFLETNRMGLCLLFAWGLLFFKWISNLMPYLMDAEYLPYTPYLLILPLLGLQIWLAGFFKKGETYYKVQWIFVFSVTIFLSKTAYDIFTSSSLGVFVRCCLFILFAAVILCIALTFHRLLNLILLNRVKPKRAYAILFVICLSGGFFFTLNIFHLPNQSISHVPQSVTSQKDKGSITKNVIIIVVDCLRADHLGCYGYARNVSPFLDSIASSGVRFENCIAPSSWTIPSVVSLFTGVYPQQHGMNKRRTIMPEGLATLQEIMSKQGMMTAAFIPNPSLASLSGHAKGFDHYFDYYVQQTFKEYVASRLFFLNAVLHFKNDLFYPYPVEHRGARWWSVGFPPFDHEKRSAERVTNDVLRWIQTYDDKPFYAYVHYMDVHCPYDTFWYPLYNSQLYPSQNLKEKRINIYDGRIVYVDQQIKRIWEELRRLNLSDNTLLIVTADHGEELYDHEGTGHCTTLYEELIRVPLILFNPSLSQMGQRLEQQVQLIDLPVTVLDFLGLRVPEQMKGKSLLPLIGDTPPLTEPAYALSYTTRGRKNLKTKEGRELWKKRIWDQGGVLTSLRFDNAWKIIIGDDGQTELFNLKEDKSEQNDLKKKEQLIVEDLKGRLREESSALKSFVPTVEKQTLSPDTRNRLKALGYL